MLPTTTQKKVILSNVIKLQPQKNYSLQIVLFQFISYINFHNTFHTFSLICLQINY